MNNLVTVIVPVYNTAEYISKCIKSILCQTHKALEVIIIDDGSCDESLSICKKLQNEDSRINIVRQENNGASMARNVGLNMAHGEYLMFVDSDDQIDSEMIEQMLKTILATNVDIIISKIPGEMQVYKQTTDVSQSETLLHLLRDQVWWSPCGKLFKRQLFDNIRFPRPTISEDYWIMVHLILNGANVFYVPTSYYHRTTRPDSLSHMSLCERKFDEIYNVNDVWEAVQTRKKEFASFAENNLAQTLLKLLIEILNTESATNAFSQQEKKVLSLIRQHYWSMLTNRCITPKQRTLLACCFSHFSAQIVLKLYRYVRQA